MRSRMQIPNGEQLRAQPREAPRSSLPLPIRIDENGHLASRGRSQLVASPGLNSSSNAARATSPDNTRISLGAGARSWEQNNITIQCDNESTKTKELHLAL